MAAKTSVEKFIEAQQKLEETLLNADGMAPSVIGTVVLEMRTAGIPLTDDTLLNELRKRAEPSKGIEPALAAMAIRVMTEGLDLNRRPTKAKSPKRSK